ncbi:MAG: hypothetical protein CL920_21000 [Deltaproteobacteria bacterium]|nr:hypothetical protein [Deltaproteobacteria bacterium]
MTKQDNRRRPLSFGVFLLLGLFLLVVFSFEGCSTTKKAEGTQTEPGAESVQTEVSSEQLKEQVSEAPVGKEPAKEQGTKEVAVEPTKEPKPEEPNPVDDLADAGTELIADVSDGGSTSPCVGVKGPYPDVVASGPPENVVTEFPPEELCKYRPSQCPGSTAPNWLLEDFQPKSCGYKKTYNLKAFVGYVTVLVFLSGW